MALFVATERRPRAPLVPLSVFREGAVAVPNAAILLQSMVGVALPPYLGPFTGGLEAGLLASTGFTLLAIPMALVGLPGSKSRSSGARDAGE